MSAEGSFTETEEAVPLGILSPYSGGEYNQTRSRDKHVNGYAVKGAHDTWIVTTSTGLELVWKPFNPEPRYPGETMQIFYTGLTLVESKYPEIDC